MAVTSHFRRLCLEFIMANENLAECDQIGPGG